MSEFFYQKDVKKFFRGRGPQKSTILGLFSKIDVRNFCQQIYSEKKCFSCCRFFRKIEEMGVYFGGCALIFFSQKLINIAAFVCKNYDDRARTRRFLEHPMSVFILTQYGRFVSFSGKNRLFIEFLGKSQPKTAKSKIAKWLFRK